MIAIRHESELTFADNLTFSNVIEIFTLSFYTVILDNYC